MFLKDQWPLFLLGVQILLATSEYNKCENKMVLNNLNKIIYKIKN